ncbi:S8 family serine peptidase [Streptomyces sp. A7024]|uniref:S8 family serine peptidase n=1 Tax=Streptomyces coryli TaxID=1128680 RepID=A0A6G4TW76_9ACTN|nr:S8 family serine peptidase [Streptomyces coryli]NGN63297.1 S8 family serine peptidase [Streptomyces coryli]
MPRRISGARRTVRTTRVVLAAGLVAALSAATPGLAGAAPKQQDPGPPTVKSAADKLGSADAERLEKAKAKGDKNVTFMIATAPGATEQVAKQLDAVKGGAVGRTYDKLGYVRATVPTKRAEAAIAGAAKLSSVHGIDLREVVKLPDPSPRADAVKGEQADVTGSYPAPGKNTPAKNPYQPSHETGAVDFVEEHPKADGRGVTIGVLDSGVDLAHPALQKTTTGERKITDWVTATDPIVDGDGTWRPMVTKVEGPSFTFNNRTYKAPAGSYEVSLFRESATTGGEMAGDLNRDGDTTDSWALLYDAKAGTVRVDLGDDADFGNDEVMKPYGTGHQVGYFGKDDPATAIAERIPFVVEIRKDVPMDPYGGDWVGQKRDFVSIGVVEGAHGTHVAGITAANGLFGGKMNGAAPGANVVSSRACTWSGGCTNIALTEGMIDLVTERGVDIVNMSIGGLPPLNDGNNARAELYTRLIDTYGVQLVISAGNSGPGVNTIGDPALADKVISVGASVSKATWAANYGSQVEDPYAMMPFSSRGPREDGGQTPTISAPGASVNSVPTWQPGQPVAEAGYALPPGYGMLQGTSMASPQAAGASALLLSQAKRKGVDLSPLTLRTALASTARHISGEQAYEEGAGLIDIEEAWESIEDGATAHAYSVKAPVDSALDGYLKTPGFGTGIYDRESGPAVGKSETYEVTLTRTSGSAKSSLHTLTWKNNDGTFRLLSSPVVSLPLNKPVTVKVAATPRSHGAHSAILKVDDRGTEGVDRQLLATVLTSKAQAKPSYAVKESGSVQRNSPRSYFIKVPEGAKSLEVAMSGLKGKSQTRWIAIDPWGLPADPTATTGCYPNYNPANTCRPDLRSYPNPIPGVWEIEVESRRTSPLLDNPYTVEATALGTTFDPETATIAEAKAGTPTPVDFKVTNGFAPIDGKLRGGSLGSAKQARPSIKEGEAQTTEVVIGEGVERFDATIGNTSDPGADLDLLVFRDGELVGQAADGDSEESVSIEKPEPGTYTIEVDGYAVPGGTTEYDYRDVYYAASLGSVEVDDAPVKLGNGASASVQASVTAAGAAPEGREFFGEVTLLNGRGTATGKGSIAIEKVVP